MQYVSVMRRHGFVAHWDEWKQEEGRKHKQA